jgi:hypothetical protein
MRKKKHYKRWSKFNHGATVRIRKGGENGVSKSEGGGKVGTVVGYSRTLMRGTVFVRCEGEIYEIHECWLDPSKETV